MYQVQQQDIDLLKQRVRTIYTKIQLLNDEFAIMDEIEGTFLDGNMTIDAGSDIRRTFSGTIFLKNESWKVAEDARIWINRHVKIYIGYLYQRTQEIRWYPLGIFNFCDNSFCYDSVTKQLNVSCVDLVSQLNGDLAGELVGLETKIYAGDAIRDTLVHSITQLGGIKKYIISYRDAAIPYDMSWDTGATVWDILTDIRDLYYSYEMYFDGDVFVCRRVPMNSEEDVVLGDAVLKDLVISEKVNNSISEVRNVVEVFGATTEADYFLDDIDCDGTPCSVYSIRVKGSDYTAMSKNGKKIAFVVPNGNQQGCRVRFVDSETASVLGEYALYYGTDAEGVDQIIPQDMLPGGTYHVVQFQNGKLYYVGQSQVHAIAVLTNQPPDDSQAGWIGYGEDRDRYGCPNIGYVTNPESPFTTEKIGERLCVCSGGEFDNIYTDELALERCEYEIYKRARLTDTVTLECILIPWLDVNNKVTYRLRNDGESAEERQYMITRLDFDFTSGTMSMTMARFYPFYPNTVKLPEAPTATS